MTKPYTVGDVMQHTDPRKPSSQAALVAELLSLSEVLQDSGVRREDTKRLVSRFIEIEKSLGFISPNYHPDLCYSLRSQAYLGKRSEYVFFKDILTNA